MNICTPSLPEQRGFSQNTMQPHGTQEEPHAAWKPHFVNKR
jgi:hypothetical protein